MTHEELNKVLDAHKKWLNGEDGGVKANLQNADLRNADLQNTDLQYATLQYATLQNADLRNAALRNADLRNADLRNADLRNTDLRNAALQNADLQYATLQNATLDFDVIQCSGIGSMRRMTTYIPKDNLILCGCFNGTLEEFEAKIKETHKDNPKHLGNYLAMVEMFKTQKEFCK